jgi:hypothetical protein
MVPKASQKSTYFSMVILAYSVGESTLAVGDGNVDTSQLSVSFAAC